jgi:APA family basic amino acid/polyamine antiporter
MQRGVTIAVLFVLALVNCRGVKWGGVLQFFITLIKVGSLLAIAVLPFVVASLWHPAEPSARPDASRLRLLPEAGVTATVGGFGSALLAVLWAYHGWQNLTPVAEEVRSPQRNLPLALLTGVGIIILVYLGANLAFSLVLPRTDMAALSDKDTSVSTRSRGEL